MRFPWIWRRKPPSEKQVKQQAIRDALSAFERRTGIRFGDRGILEQALTHRSFLGSNGGDPNRSNERLEFLGDSVLELIVIEHLYRSFPLDREGELTKKKSLLVSKGVLATRAEQMGLGEFVLLSDSERDSGGAERASILADSFEAVVGAIYLDRGIRRARRFVETHLLATATTILEDRAHLNFKSLLQEYVQAKHKTHPRYRVVSEIGPDHMKLFTVDVSVRGSLLGKGQGRNKKEAEQNAAGDALERLRLEDRTDPILNRNPDPQPAPPPEEDAGS
ncbi:MAG: ribonuclease III [Candidatus Eisenbacteria bacterium]|nr:ribonuclease III [Candidatus Latescibacterota bacterium]MBD3302378.1 ribonuclease III [Candidatus Eisenbacteria bacterium]